MSPRWRLGSGFVVKAAVVVTAAHNLGDSPNECGPAGTVVRTLDGVECPATVLGRSDEIDLALLAVPDIHAQPAKVGKLDREHIDVVRNVMAASFPNYKNAATRPQPTSRQPAQPVGSVPTVEDLPGGQLTLKVEAGEPAQLPGAGRSPWEGLSGAGVVVGDCLLGVVMHSLAEGNSARRVLPLTRLAQVPIHERTLFCAILGIDDPVALPLVGEEEGPAPLRPSTPPRRSSSPLTLADTKAAGVKTAADRTADRGARSDRAHARDGLG